MRRWYATFVLLVGSLVLASLFVPWPSYAVLSSKAERALESLLSRDGTLATKLTRRTCLVAVGDPGADSSVLANDNDSPVMCTNEMGSDWTITTVACWADAGSPTVTPVLTGGTATSLLTGALTCGTAAWAAGTVNGAPIVKTFSGAGATCTTTPCSIDVNITTAGGVAKYLVVKISGTM